MTKNIISVFAIILIFSLLILGLYRAEEKKQDREYIESIVYETVNDAMNNAINDAISKANYDAVDDNQIEKQLSSQDVEMISEMLKAMMEEYFKKINPTIFLHDEKSLTNIINDVVNEAVINALNENDDYSKLSDADMLKIAGLVYEEYFPWEEILEDYTFPNENDDKETKVNDQGNIDSKDESSSKDEQQKSDKEKSAEEDKPTGEEKLIEEKQFLELTDKETVYESGTEMQLIIEDGKTYVFAAQMFAEPLKLSFSEECEINNADVFLYSGLDKSGEVIMDREGNSFISSEDVDGSYYVAVSNLPTGSYEAYLGY